MAKYFISDLHLCPERPDITAGFQYFLEHIATDATELYILGDLFEFWIGDDDKSELAEQVAQLLSQFAKAGRAIYHIHGNRDFFLKQAYGQRAKMKILPEQELIDLFGQKTIILHGDTLCIDDQAYQTFRRRVHIPWAQALYLALPLFIRQKIANRIRAKSSAENQIKSTEIMDVTHSEVVRQFQEQKATLMIHGHTHRPAIHELQINEQSCKRIVLGAWYDEISYLKAEGQSLELLNQAFPK